MQSTIKKMVLGLGVMCLCLSVTTHAAAAADNADTDADGLSDQVELRLHTDPKLTDSDADGVDDYTEVFRGDSPRDAKPVKLNQLDSDSDGLSDAWEFRLGTDILNPDTDSDGYADSDELKNAYSPTSTEPIKVEKRIEVSLAKQHLTYFFGSVTLEHFPISSGLRATPTPTGTFSVIEKKPVVHYRGADYYLPNTKWNMHFTTGYAKYYIHGAYWHNNFGHPMSHGCVNVSYANMEKLYGFSDVGTPIIITKE